MTKKMSHEESVELMLLFICSQLAISNSVDKPFPEEHKEAIAQQLLQIASVINLSIAKDYVH